MLRLAALALLLLPGGADARQDAPAVADPASTSISLTRTACYGRCPIYTVSVRSDGLVQYKGEGFVLVEGEHAYRIDASAAQALIERFRKAGFWKLRGSYAADITDNPTQILTMTVGGETGTISDYAGLYAGMPPIVAELEKAVDETSDVARMVTGNARTLEVLDAEPRWDFHASQSAAMLRRAAQVAPDDVVSGLLDRGADPDGDQRPESASESEGLETPLSNAAKMARLGVVRRLIAAGASTSGPWLTAAFRGAIESEHPATLAEILRYKPDMNAPVSGTYGPLGWVDAGAHPRYGAPDADRAGIIKLLVAAGARP